MAKPISILKPGSFRSMSGQDVSFTAADLEQAAAAYDPALHEAPIVVGHPKTDDPAYGWIKSLKVVEGELVAEPHQVDEQFADLVGAGRFKKVSPALYRPDAPGNPKPGHWYLRHVGFLGAQPPAVKGLKQVALAEGEGIVELAADGWMIGDIAGMFRSIRDFIVGQFGQEAADKALPGDRIDYLLQTAGREQQKDMATSSFADPSDKETDVKTEQEKQAAELKAAQDKLAADQVALAEREKEVKAEEGKARRAEIGRFVDQLVTDGKLPPARKDGLVAFMAALPTDDVVEFSEGGNQVKQSPDNFLRGFLSQLGKVIEFGEIAGGDAKVPAEDAVALAEEIRGEQDKAAQSGRPISASEALERVKKRK
jgi:hypothetical protein